jgi:GR25 family glycosyltransferase involved in LPS biosynthesis
VKAFVITLDGHAYSQGKAARCIETAAQIGGIAVERFHAVDRWRAQGVMKSHGLRWTWANENRFPDTCPHTGLRQHPYGNLKAKMGCAMSHFQLWQRCVDLNEPILILEHDVVFVSEFPQFDFYGICQINDPDGATPRGQWWSQAMRKRGTVGVHLKTKVLEDDVPDGLAGNSAYVVKPFAAQELIDTVRDLGVWPNDATMCRQLFPYLEEYFPFVTKVEQEQSTSSA